MQLKITFGADEYIARFPRFTVPDVLQWIKDETRRATMARTNSPLNPEISARISNVEIGPDVEVSKGLEPLYPAGGFILYGKRTERTA